MLVEDESIFIYDLVLAKKRRGIVKEKRPVVTTVGSHYKTIIYGSLSLNGKQLCRQYERLNSSQPFIAYLEGSRKKFDEFTMFVDRATLHRSKIVKEYLRGNIEEAIKIDIFLWVYQSLI